MTKSIKSIVGSFGDYVLVDVETHSTKGLPAIIIIGDASRVVDEAKDRLRASFSNSDLVLPKNRITINIAPADIRKDDSGLDLAMACSILLTSKQITQSYKTESLIIGELGLNGSIKSVRGVIGKIIAGQKAGFKRFIIPSASLEQARVVPNVELYAFDNLRQLYLYMTDSVDKKPLKTRSALTGDIPKPANYVDFNEVAGQHQAKRALEIAAAGRHNILLFGPPGTGKSMLAKALPGILPPLELDEVLEVTHLHSLNGSQQSARVHYYPPVRSPHHSSSTVALIGGGANPKPGEISLAHKGILLLDELLEFNRSALEALRQPLEDGVVSIARARDSVMYPASFILVATQNPCPCGNLGSQKPCQCSMSAILRYQQRVSGPILDRIDLFVSVNDIAYEQIITDQPQGESSEVIQARVKKAIAVQHFRFDANSYNSQMTNKTIKSLANLSPAAKQLLDQASAKLNLSARAYVRCIKTARTIADLDGSPLIEVSHISEAIQYRQPATSRLITA